MAGNPGGKSVIVSPPGLLDQLTSQFLALGIFVVDHARNLGIDIFFTPRRHSEVRDARRKAVELRLTKVFSLKRTVTGGAWKVGRCGLWPAYSYGHAITGMSQAERAFARRIVFGTAPGSASGRSAAVTLALSGFDPAVEIDAGPLILFADLAWEADGRRRAQIRRAWEFGVPKFPPTLAATKGPVSLALFSANKLGWVPQPDPGNFKTLRGRDVNVIEVSPTEIRWEAKRDAELSLWREWGVGKCDPPLNPCWAQSNPL